MGLESLGLPAMNQHNLIHDSADEYGAIRVIDDGQYRILSFAEGDEQRMMLMGLKRYTKYTNYPDIVDLRNEIAEKVKAENKYCF